MKTLASHSRSFPKDEAFDQYTSRNTFKAIYMGQFLTMSGLSNVIFVVLDKETILWSIVRI